MSTMYPPIYELHQVRKTDKGASLHHIDDYPSLQAARHQATTKLTGRAWMIFEKMCVDTNIGKPASE